MLPAANALPASSGKCVAMRPTAPSKSALARTVGAWSAGICFFFAIATLVNGNPVFLLYFGGGVFLSLWSLWVGHEDK